MTAFKAKHKRHANVWLDKVCINQDNQGFGLSVLPINIGACKKLLIVMSESYLNRLWCIWELFTLFTFCNKELALQRIEIIFLDGTESTIVQKLKSFNLNDAHCFDPNEEFKLRHIMRNIGLDRLDACISALTKKLDLK